MYGGGEVGGTRLVEVKMYYGEVKLMEVRLVEMRLIGEG